MRPKMMNPNGNADKVCLYAVYNYIITQYLISLITAGRCTTIIVSQIITSLMNTWRTSHKIKRRPIG